MQAPVKFLLNIISRIGGVWLKQKSAQVQTLVGAVVRAALYVTKDGEVPLDPDETLLKCMKPFQRPKMMKFIKKFHNKNKDFKYIILYLQVFKISR